MPVVAQFGKAPVQTVVDAAIVTTIGMPIYIDSFGVAQPASAIIADTPKAIAIVKDKPSVTKATIVTDGRVAGFLGLSVGQDVYLAATLGGISQTPPSVPGTRVQRLGVPLSATDILVDVDSSEIIN